MNDFGFVIREFRYVFWAYNLIWLLLAGYLGFILVRLNRVARDVKRLSESERRADQGPAPAASGLRR